MEDSVEILVSTSTMEEGVTKAAQAGDIEGLYRVIREKANVLREIDRMEFVDTPLHLAAAAGHTEFVMELTGLKPSFATKLNQDGLSPIHLALQKGNSKTALSLLKFDKNLVRVRGKNGYTPLHYVVWKGDDEGASDAPSGDHPDVLTTFLNACPECIHDVTNQNETALHVAAKKNKLGAIRVLLRWLWSSDCSMLQINNILNMKNEDGNTVLHIAASNCQPKLVRLLTTYRIISLKATNSDKLTALGILLQKGEINQDNKKCQGILRNAQLVSDFVPWRILEQMSQLAYEIKSMSGDRSNALLVVTVLILTATYQATLSPPGGVFQANFQSKDNTTTSVAALQNIHPAGSHNNSTPTHPWHLLLKRSLPNAGSSVLDTAPFLWFFIPNIAAFYISLLVTCFLLVNILPVFLSSALIISLSMLLFCLLISAVLIISPNSQSLHIMLQYVYILAYIFFAVMCIIVFIELASRLRRKWWPQSRVWTLSKWEKVLGKLKTKK